MVTNMGGIITTILSTLGLGLALGAFGFRVASRLYGKLDGKIDKLGGDLRAEIRGVRTELTARIDAVHGELIDTRVHLSDRVARLEGAVLGAAAPEPVRESA